MAVPAPVEATVRTPVLTVTADGVVSAAPGCICTTADVTAPPATLRLAVVAPLPLLGDDMAAPAAAAAAAAAAAEGRGDVVARREGELG